ncbi:predicted protein [Pyrenophora tritici-repentis Pt-1C-BFP]|uniref:Uncharacterized protein n=1 Tax=Pyrenophora tritici-repentis (strain Pt-1C-BFP) TaxID=426418 RepID=B2W144_PYRTR|nr:uncharacterized protein PTRG_04179 [Pyrenophora tritici-repentis Pt-1C-BFP]EDU47017.1 predicted protein [Pyrenophora tritici-repentis Pt-1C-BFP]
MQRMAPLDHNDGWAQLDAGFLHPFCWPHPYPHHLAHFVEDPGRGRHSDHEPDNDKPQHVVVCCAGSGAGYLPIVARR